MSNFIRINVKDNVAVAATDLKAGSTVTFEGRKIVLIHDIPQAHKFALRPISIKEDVIKYGYRIGQASAAIGTGEHVHTHNLHTGLQETLNYTYTPKPFTQIDVPKLPATTFNGFLRADGKAGIRNEIWILPTVGCMNQSASIIAQTAADKLRPYSWAHEIDGIYEFKHQFGCSQLGADHLATQRLLTSLAHHPNAAGVLFLSLGCENNQVEQIKHSLGNYDPDRIKFLIAQDIEDEIETGTDIVVQLARRASSARRQILPLKYLTVGLKCGGSDGLSGITANPLVGLVSDMITKVGGTSILTEVPEMFGAEQILMNRAKNISIFETIVDLINEFKQYYLDHKQPIYENPSPGNKRGGITTLEDKSLGCTEKGGKSEVTAVLDYGELTQVPGLNLLCSPGNDSISITALAAAGCQLVLYTTGRGTPLGTASPSIKIASNSRLTAKKPHWIDFNAGILAEGADFTHTAIELFKCIIAVANGKKTKSELIGFREIAIWKNGVTL